MKLGPRATLALVSLLFFVTGMLGLGYELIWIRRSTLVVGASQIALSTVLTAFFLGLALGSYLIGHAWRSRRIPPLVLYGIFEIGIGIYALLFPWLFQLAEAAYGALHPSFAGSSAALFGLRFALLVGLFLAPTVLMGGTLPVLLEGIVTGGAHIGARTSFLYGINILGAVAGVLLTSYLAIPGIGLSWTSRLGGLVNLLIGATAIAFFGRRGAPAPTAAEDIAPRLHRFFPAAAFVSGLLAIAYQVAWARYFTLFQTTTVYLTAVLLAVYLLALASGSLLLAPALQARWRPLGVLATVQALVPVLALWGIEWWRAADYRFALRGRPSERGPVPLETLEIDPAYAGFWTFVSETADAIFFAPVFQVALTLFLPVLLLGVGLPSLIAAAAHGALQLRSVSGRLIFWNTIGASAGGFLGGYLLIPVLGLHWTMIALGCGSLALSIAARVEAGREAAVPAAASRRERRQAERSAGAPPRLHASAFALQAAAVVAIGIFVAAKEDISTSTIRKYGYGRDPGLARDAAAAAKGAAPRLTEIVEGPLTTSFVFETEESVRIGSGNVCLAVAYKNAPSTQAIQGHLPSILYPGSGLPKECLGICLGSGQSFGALLLYPIERLDVVDISGEITRLSLEHFAPYNHGLGADPRVRFHLDDGRHFVERSPDGSYDVVSMEPPPPTADGVYSLYSLEFYEEVRRVLREGGVFIQWLPLYRVTPLDLEGLLRTQAEVFPETFVVKVGNDDFMIASYKARPVFLLDAVEERLETLAGERLVSGRPWATGSGHEIASLEGYLSSILTGPAHARDEAGMVYRDDTQRLGYSSGDRWLLRRYEGPTLSRISFPALELTPFRDLAGYFDPPLSQDLVETLEAARAKSLSMFQVPDPVELERFRAAAARAGDPRERAQAALFAAALLDGMLRKEEAYALVERAVEAMEGAKISPLPVDIDMARSIVRNGLAPFEEVTVKWLDRIEKKAPGSALLSAMRAELRTYLERDEARKSRYWFR